MAVSVQLSGTVYGRHVFPALPREVVRARERFLEGFRAGVRRGPAEATRAALEAEMADLGRALGQFCLPDGTGAALAELVDGCGVGTVVEVCYEADNPELLGLPFEALRLPDDRVLATLPPVVTPSAAGRCQGNRFRAARRAYQGAGRSGRSR